MKLSELTHLIGRQTLSTGLEALQADCSWYSAKGDKFWRFT